MSGFELASLRTIDGGNAIEKFDFELQRTVENCLDQNTDPKAIRTITLKVKIKPSADRTSADVTYQAQSSLPADAPGASFMVFSRGAAHVPKAEQLTIEGYGDAITEINDVKLSSNE